MCLEQCLEHTTDCKNVDYYVLFCFVFQGLQQSLEVERARSSVHLIDQKIEACEDIVICLILYS